jgi:hypothetical protein
MKRDDMKCDITEMGRLLSLYIFFFGRLDVEHSAKIYLSFYFTNE